MSGTTLTIVIIAILIVAAIAVWVAMEARRKRRQQMLRDQFGPEYERSLEGSKRRDAERELQGRIDLRNRFEVRPLTPAARDRYAAQWSEVQTHFVDQPGLAVADADGLVSTVMRERGYPIDDWDTQASVVSVDHPQIVEDYRFAHDVSERNRTGQASTDDLREAFLRYRSLFDALLETPENEDARQS
jgi:hypothetical protein